MPVPSLADIAAVLVVRPCSSSSSQSCCRCRSPPPLPSCCCSRRPCCPCPSPPPSSTSESSMSILNVTVLRPAVSSFPAHGAADPDADPPSRAALSLSACIAAACSVPRWNRPLSGTCSMKCSRPSVASIAGWSEFVNSILVVPPCALKVMTSLARSITAPIALRRPTGTRKGVAPRMMTTAATPGAEPMASGTSRAPTMSARPPMPPHVRGG